MKLIDKANLGGGKYVGRRVYYRKQGNQRIETPAATFVLAERQANGTYKTKNLETALQAEAIERAQQHLRSKASDAIPPPASGTPDARITIVEATRLYMEFTASKGRAPKTITKYRAEMDRLLVFAASCGLILLDEIDERVYFGYGAWMRTEPHKQSRTYSSKSIHTSAVVLKQLMKFAHRHQLIARNPIESASTPKGHTNPQPCPSPDEAERMAATLDTPYREAVLILFFTGMRVGEVLALRWTDILRRDDLPVKIHVQRGGSADTTKDAEARLIPVHPRLVDIFAGLDRSHPTVMPPMRDRMILRRVKQAAEAAGIEGRMTTHGLRHGFASMAANSGIAYRLVLEWMGHHSSDILDLYYKAHDRSSEFAMQEMAAHTQRVWGSHER